MRWCAVVGLEGRVVAVVVVQVGFFRGRRCGGSDGVAVVGSWWRRRGVLLLGKDGGRRDKVGKKEKMKILSFK